MGTINVRYRSKTYGIDKMLDIIVDDDVYEKYKNIKFSVSAEYGLDLYYFRYFEGRPKYLHREIMECPLSLQVDHINNNTLDCRRVNLRIVTKAQNAANRRSKNKNHRGVYKKSNGKYSISVTQDGLEYLVRYFETELEASRKYDELAKFVHGDYAHQNHS